jgi:hypothetical protein
MLTARKMEGHQTTRFKDLKTYTLNPKPKTQQAGLHAQEEGHACPYRMSAQPATATGMCLCQHDSWNIARPQGTHMPTS